MLFRSVTDIIKHFNSVTSSPVGFPALQRSGPLARLMRCPRFACNSVKFGWKNGKTQVLCFSVNRDVLFHGVNLFGSETNTYSVALILFVMPENVTNLLTSTMGTFSSLPHSSGEFYCFDVLFQEPIPLAKGEVYNLVATVTGPKSWYGTQGHQTSNCSAASFTIKDIAFLSEDLDWASPERGQLNEFIFSIKK